VLATFAREGGATIADAKTLWQRGIELFGPREQDPDMESALDLATGNRISAYDAQYVALARRLQTVCVTEDQRLLKTFPELTRTMQAFAATYRR
jgi:predicted nucleic acid-binding protein